MTPFRRLAVALALVAPGFASASLVAYSNAAAFNAANPGAELETFGGLVADDGSSTGDYTAGVALGSDSFSVNAVDGANLLAVGANYFGSGYFNGTSAALSGQNAPVNTITISFASPVKAFALGYGSFDATDSLTLADSAGDSLQLSGTDGQSSPRFAGYSSDVNLTWVSLSSAQGGVVNLADVQTATPAPEPASFAAIALGLAAFARRRR